jgi:hypothetical protein
MKLTYSDHRFKLLFRAIDGGGGGDGNISEQELNDFLFPPSLEDLESGRLTKRQSMLNEKGQDEASVVSRLLAKGRSKGSTDMDEGEDHTIEEVQVVHHSQESEGMKEEEETKVPAETDAMDKDTLGDLQPSRMLPESTGQSRDMRAESVDSTDLNRMV